MAPVAVGVVDGSLTVDTVLAAGLPDPRLVSAAAGMFARSASDVGVTAQTAEGPSAFVVVSPGTLRLGTVDLARRHRRENRDSDRRPLPGHCPTWAALRGAGPGPGPGRHVVEWSRKSRARMVETMASIDWAALYRGAVPAMVTLTYPGDWLTVAPDAATAKGHLEAFRKRYARRWNRPAVAAWKLEFQRRGAPHFHLLMPVPLSAPAHSGGVTRSGRPAVTAGCGCFSCWLAECWAAVVAHPDPVERARHRLAGTGVDFREGSRMRDPRRISVYFSGHSLKRGPGAKEYQHVVPEAWRDGPGRFWGIWVLKPTRCGVMLSVREWLQLRRFLRRWARANGRSGLFSSAQLQGGWVIVNDGPSFAADLARALALSQCPGYGNSVPAGVASP